MTQTPPYVHFGRRLRQSLPLRASDKLFRWRGSGASARKYLEDTSRRWGQVRARAAGLLPSPPSHRAGRLDVPDRRSPRILHPRGRARVALRALAATSRRRPPTIDSWGYGAVGHSTSPPRPPDPSDINRPWEIGNGVRRSATCGPRRRRPQIGPSEQGGITLKCNGKVAGRRPHADDLDVPEGIGKLSGWFALARGDSIMTGTPSGVAADRPGDKLDARSRASDKLTINDGPMLK